MPFADANELKKLKVAELKELLQSYGMSTAGKKDELVARLVEHDIAAPSASALTPKPDADEETMVPKPPASPKKVATSIPASMSTPVVSSDTSAKPTTGGSVSAAVLTDEEKKRKLRAERFGLIDTKLEQRAERFGLTSASSPVQEDILKKRADRFNLNTPASPGTPGGSNAKKPRLILTAEDEEKMRKRKERFGL